MAQTNLLESAPANPSFFANSSAPVPASYWQVVRIQSNAINEAVLCSHFLATIAQKSGGVVTIDPHYSSLPVVIGRDNSPVLLFRVVEQIDAHVDYSRIQDSFPNLSYGQIAGAIAFLRCVAQFNIRSVDIDKLEDEWLESSPDFQSQLMNSLNDTEVTRVLPTEQLNSR